MMIDKKDLTKERLLDEAEILFAQKGYQAVSIREITKAAHSNLAAVNYHFGNKQNLYMEVFRLRWVPRARRLRDFFNQSVAVEDFPSPTSVIQSLARAFLEGPLSDEERQRHALLMTREIIQPTEVFELVAKEVMHPFFQELAAHLRPVMPEGIGEERMMLNILSTFAMVLYFNFARTAVTHITGSEYDPDFKKRLVEHIIGFSVKGLGLGEKEEIR